MTGFRAWTLLGLTASVSMAAAQTSVYRDLHDFAGQINNGWGTFFDGAGSQAAVSFDADGNMFGTTTTGGANGWGMVWEITKDGTYFDIHDFGGTVTNADGKSGPDGNYPDGAGVSFDAQGNMYGTTRQGGANLWDDVHGYKGGGMVWEITKGGVYKDLHDFAGQVTRTDGSAGVDGFYPDSAGVTFDSAGNMYGTTCLGGLYGDDFNIQNGFGVIWEITKDGVYKDLHDFGGTSVTHAEGASVADGFGSLAPVTVDADGNLYGTTSEGGAFDSGDHQDGIVWKLTKAGAYIVLHDFAGTVKNANGKKGPDGRDPYAGVTIDAQGNLFGTTLWGGANYPFAVGAGIVWEITKAGVYKDLHDFGGTTTNANGKIGPDGISPYYGGVRFDSVGNMYGTTQQGGEFYTGQNFGGTLWEITKAGRYADLYDFGGKVTNANGQTGNDGQFPLNAVTFDKSGNMFGTTCMFGANARGGGIVWEVESAVLLSSVTVSPKTAIGGVTVSGTVNLKAPASIGGTTVSLASTSSNAKVPASLVIPAGVKSLPFTITTSPVAVETAIGITAHQLSSKPIKGNFTLDAPSLLRCSLSPATVIGGAHSVGTVTLNGRAPSTGLTVQLASSAANYVAVPASVKVPAGATTATFPVTTKVYTANYSAVITATAGAATKSATLAVQDDSIKSLSLQTSSVLGGKSVLGTVYLVGAAPSTGWTVKLSSTSSQVQVPATVVVATGKTYATFTVTTKAATLGYAAVITATDTLSHASATLTVLDDSVVKLTISPATVVGGTAATGTVTLRAAAPTGGWAVNLSSSGPAKVPATLTVPAGATTATFSITTTVVSASVTANITASDALSQKSASLVVKPK